eukprot:gene400-4_t
MTDDKKEGGGSFVRRDRLIEIQNNMQKLWAENKAYEAVVDDAEGRETFFATFPYPYMNGKLHLGHAFTITKAEFAARFQQLNGKQVLWPFAYHCTGMPICAAANKLKAELENAGKEQAEEEPTASETPEKKEEKELNAEKFSGKKSKAVAKTGTAVTQYEMLKMSGIPEDIIPEFSDPYFWCKYFPPLANEDLNTFGCAIDWRRSFVTTDLNRYYDKFIRWQFERLHKDDYVKFGKREVIWSITDGQPCADHDRASGEGAKPQEYTLIKMKVQEVPEQFKEACGTSKVYFVAATLRPETMFGQTNCFLLLEGDYGFFKMKNNEIFVCTERSAINMYYQGLGEEDSKVYSKTKPTPPALATCKGQDLIGVPLSAPFAQYPTVYVLPMFTISMTKGTGVVTSVPSNAPDDYAALRDWREKENWRTKFGVKKEWCDFDVVPIIEIDGQPELTNIVAKKLIEDNKVDNHKQTDKLKVIKADIYKTDFYKGKFLSKEEAPFLNAKALVRKKMLADGDALPYYEPESQVISRSGDECIVAFADQWYLNYSNEAWSGRVREHIQDTLECYSSGTKNGFLHCIGWLGDWACTRTMGLGTRLPWDEEWLIESLSDSTLYFAYYTIAHLLQAMFDYVFGFSETVPEGIEQATLDNMRKEFKHWYPMNLRVSGKDLIQNHLTMALLNHAAIFKENPEYWPRSYYCNGHVQVDNQKMSKSKGNFLVLGETCKDFSADAVRYGCADAGDTLEDANFCRETVQQGIMRLYNFEHWAQEVIQQDLRTGEKTFLDKAFENEIARLVADAKKAYESMCFKDALRCSWYEMSNLRDDYRTLTEGDMHKDLLMYYIEVQALVFSPICPHFCEHLWTEILKKDTLVVKSLWPEAKPVDEVLAAKFKNLLASMRQFRLDAQKALGKKKDLPTPTHAVIYDDKEYKDWQQKCLKWLQGIEFGPDNVPTQKDFMRKFRDDVGSKLDKMHQKKAMQF